MAALMHPERLRALLEEVRRGERSVDEALAALRALPYEDLGFAKIDHHRALRTGFPEVVLGEGKTAAQIAEIARRLRARRENVLVTRLAPAVANEVRATLPELDYRPEARLGMLGEREKGRAAGGKVLVVSAGTADLPVAEEAALSAEFMGNEVERLYDVGVAGLHRLVDNAERLRAAAVIIVVAGMEGALPSVVGGLVDRPVIAVPTSTGYGAAFGGIAALLGMLTSCAAGVTVVNIDNGFGAAVAASLINRR